MLGLAAFWSLCCPGFGVCGRLAADFGSVVLALFVSVLAAVVDVLVVVVEGGGLGVEGGAAVRCCAPGAVRCAISSSAGASLFGLSVNIKGVCLQGKKGS